MTLRTISVNNLKQMLNELPGDLLLDVSTTTDIISFHDNEPIQKLYSPGFDGFTEITLVDCVFAELIDHKTYVPDDSLPTAVYTNEYVNSLKVRIALVKETLKLALKITDNPSIRAICETIQEELQGID